MKKHLHFLNSDLPFLSPLHAEKPGWDVAARQPLPAAFARHRMRVLIAKHFIPFGNQIHLPMKSIAPLLLLMLLLVQASCKKDKSPDPGPLYIPQEVKDYAQFKPGTYWVYIDSVSGRVDSVYVKSFKWGYDTLEIYDNPRRAYEWFETIAHSEMDGYDYYYFCSTSYSYNPNLKVIVYVEKAKPGNYIGKNIFLAYTLKIGETFNYLNSNFLVKDMLTNYNANGINFLNVILLFHDFSAAEPSNNVTNFIASHYGIIRKEYADSNQVWVLARSNIIQ